VAAQARHVTETSSNLWVFHDGKRHHPQPSPRSGVSAAAGPRLLIHQVQYLLSSQLTFISEGSSPIRRMGTRLVAYSSAPTRMTVRPIS